MACSRPVSEASSEKVSAAKTKLQQLQQEVISEEEALVACGPFGFGKRKGHSTAKEQQVRSV